MQCSAYMYSYRARSTDSEGPTISSTDLKSNYSQLPELSLRVPQTIQTSQRSAPSVKVDESIDDEDSSYY